MRSVFLVPVLMAAAGIALGCGALGRRSAETESGDEAKEPLKKVATAPPPARPGPAVPMAAPAFPYAVTYEGDIPCADCAVIHLTLTLFPDDTFRLRQEYGGVPAHAAVNASGANAGQERPALYDVGRRVREKDASDASLLVLQGSDTAPLRFRAVEPDRLRKLDREGREIESPLNYDLTFQPTVDTIAGPMRLKGLYRYMADAAVFQECRSGKNFPVVPVGEAASLQSAYLAARHAPGKPLLANVEGLFVERAPEPGAAVRDHLIVERFAHIGPGAACTGQ